MLTVRQAAFVAAYTATGNATQSAITAGYAESSAAVTGSQLLRHPKVAAALANVHTKAVERVQVKLSQDAAVASAEWIVEKAAELVTYGTSYQPKRNMFGGIILDETGAQVMEMTDPKLAAPALGLLAKRHKEFSEKHILSGDPDNPVTIERRTRSTQ